MNIFKFLRDAQYGLRGVRVGEASNPGPHNLVFRRIRRASTATTVPPTVVDVTSTEVESNMPGTHLLTDVDGSESVASSGFLNMFERDLDVEAFPTRMDAPDRDGENDDESASCQTGASEVHEVSDSEQEEAESNLATPVVQLGTQSLRGGLQSWT